MISIRPIWIHRIKEAAAELEKIGFPRAQVEELAAETICLHLKLEGISRSMAECLRAMAFAQVTQPMIPPISSNKPGGDTLLLSGTLSQMERLTVTMEGESPELRRIAVELREVLKNIQRTRFTIPCRTKTLELGERTLIMGTVNVTPDSFSDGGVFSQRERAVARALKMVEEGVDIIDIGGESTRPGAEPVDPKDEIARVVPVIKEVAKQTDIPISVDTRRANVACEALEAGGQIVNDVSALRFDPDMARVVASHKAPVILMHMRGTPETMQQNIRYVSLMSEIAQYLRESMNLACQVGVDPDRIVIDPGIGFGKTVDHNLAIIKHLYQLRILGKPILIGTSRKSFIGKILKLDVDQREEGTMASVTASILNGAHIVRVHNVRNAVRVARIADAIKGVNLPEA